MKKVDAFLEKFKDITPPDQVVKRETADVIADIVGVKLDTEDISVDTNGIRITTSPAAKSSIFIHKEKILTHLKEKLEESAPEDIQ